MAKDGRLTIRLGTELLDKVQAASGREDRSPSAWVKRLIKRELAPKKAKEKEVAV